MDAAALELLDDALIRLRRLWVSGDHRVALERGVGTTVEMSSVLVVDAVARAAAAGEEPTVGAVAARLDVDPSTGSRFVERAASAGLVVRSPSPTDARRTVLRLTAAGEGLAADATRFRLGYLQRLLDDWPDDERAALARLLGRFADAVQSTPLP